MNTWYSEPTETLEWYIEEIIQEGTMINNPTWDDTEKYWRWICEVDDTPREVTKESEVDKFDRHLNEFWVTELYEAEKYSELLEAKKAVVVKVDKYRSGVEMVDDHATQLQALKLLWKLRKRFDDKQKNNVIQNFYNKIVVLKK